MHPKDSFSTVDEYIALYPPAIRKNLQLIRKTIRQAAPDAEETISYMMPAYRLHGMLVFFSAAKTHYGFYPGASPIPVFKEKLKGYDTSKGTVRFPVDKPVPTKLIKEIVKFKVAENKAKDALKSKAKKK